MGFTWYTGIQALIWYDICIYAHAFINTCMHMYIHMIYIQFVQLNILFYTGYCLQAVIQTFCPLLNSVRCDSSGASHKDATTIWAPHDLWNQQTYPREKKKIAQIFHSIFGIISTLIASVVYSLGWLLSDTGKAWYPLWVIYSWFLSVFPEEYAMEAPVTIRYLTLYNLSIFMAELCICLCILCICSCIQLIILQKVCHTRVLVFRIYLFTYE